MSWSDFKGDPDINSKFKAMTWTSILVNTIKVDREYIQAKIYCSFLPYTSWTKDSDSKDLLKHEQLHFDISELITRKIRKNYSKHICKNFDETVKVLDGIYHNFKNQELDSINFQYDSITNHGINKKEQKEWEEKIAKELKSLEQFSSTKVIIKREVKKQSK